MCNQNNEEKLVPHKHKEVLIAIAEGRPVQVWNAFSGEWSDWDDRKINPLSRPDINFRIKPKIVRKYSYAFKEKGLVPQVSLPVYWDDEHFQEIAQGRNIEWFQRLDNSVIEVEE